MTSCIMQIFASCRLGGIHNLRVQSHPGSPTAAANGNVPCKHAYKISIPNTAFVTGIEPLGVKTGKAFEQRVAMQQGMSVQLKRRAQPGVFASHSGLERNATPSCATKCRSGVPCSTAVRSPSTRTGTKNRILAASAAVIKRRRKNQLAERHDNQGGH